MQNEQIQNEQRDSTQLRGKNVLRNLNKVFYQGLCFWQSKLENPIKLTGQNQP